MLVLYIVGLHQDGLTYLINVMIWCVMYFECFVVDAFLPYGKILALEKLNKRKTNGGFILNL